MKKINLNLMALLAFPVVLLVSCSNSENKPRNETIDLGIYQNQIPNDVQYKIISAETDNALSKREVVVELNKRIDLKTLENIGYIVKGGSEFDKNWIFYRLSTHKEGDPAWAISHFTPELNLEIIGTTIEQEELLEKETVIEGELVGKWKDQISSMTIFVDGGEYKMKTQFKDGSSSIDRLKKSLKNGLDRYDYLEEMHGEYFIVEASGNLGLYGNDGKFDEAVKL